jgi:hypothetical protein
MENLEDMKFMTEHEFDREIQDTHKYFSEDYRPEIAAQLTLAVTIKVSTERLLRCMEKIYTALSLNEVKNVK